MNRLWSNPGVPHKGWRGEGVYDVHTGGGAAEKPAYEVCQLCGKEEIRFVHVMAHDDHPQKLEVGRVCAEKLPENYNAKERERPWRAKAARRSNWLKRGWKLTWSGNYQLTIEGHRLLIFRDKRNPGRWKFKFDEEFGQFSYASPDEAKLTLFRKLSSVLEPEEEVVGDESGPSCADWRKPTWVS